MKTSGIVAVAILPAMRIISPLRGMVVGALVGLGFEMENVIFTINTVFETGAAAIYDNLGAAVIARGLFGIPWNHTVVSAIAGAGIGLILSSRARRWATGILLIPLAVAGHLWWDLPIATPEDFGGQFSGFLLSVLTKSLPTLLAFVVVLASARRQEWELTGPVTSPPAESRDAAIAVESTGKDNAEGERSFEE